MKERKPAASFAEKKQMFESLGQPKAERSAFPLDARPIAPPKPDKYRVPSKPGHLRDKTVVGDTEPAQPAVDVIGADPDELVVEHVDGAPGQRREAYDVYKHGPPSFVGKFIMKTPNGGLVLLESQGKDLVHVPDAIGKELTKNKAVNALIDESIRSGGHPVQLYHNADNWAVRQARAPTKTLK